MRVDAYRWFSGAAALKIHRNASYYGPGDCTMREWLAQIFTYTFFASVHHFQNHFELFKANKNSNRKLICEPFPLPSFAHKHFTTSFGCVQWKIPFFCFPFQGSSWVNVESQTDFSKKLMGMLACDISPHYAGIIKHRRGCCWNHQKLNDKFDFYDWFGLAAMFAQKRCTCC